MNLKQRLEALRKAGETRIPAEAQAVMHLATEDLRQSGIVDRILKVGQKAPNFELLNQRGEQVRSDCSPRDLWSSASTGECGDPTVTQSWMLCSRATTKSRHWVPRWSPSRPARELQP
jgi:hypothetical protein